MKKQTIQSLNSLELSTTQTVIELLRPWVLLVFYFVAAVKGWWPLAVPIAFTVCLAAFIQMHDAMHRSLGVSKRAHDFVLLTSGLMLLKSGHGLQVTHLRHHGRCLKEDDREGVCATWPFYRVLIEGPLHIFTMRFYAYRGPSQTKRFQVIETMATICVLALLISLYIFEGSWVGLVYWAVAALLSATIPIWAAYLPHRLAPEHPAIRSAGRFAQIWTPLLSSFAFHHLHHANPKIPTVLLPLAARQVGPSDYVAHVHTSHNH